MTSILLRPPSWNLYHPVIVLADSAGARETLCLTLAPVAIALLKKLAALRLLLVFVVAHQAVQLEFFHVPQPPLLDRWRASTIGTRYGSAVHMAAYRDSIHAAVVQVNKHVGEEEGEEGETVEDQDVGNVVNARIADKSHLLFSGAHEEESRGVQQL